MPRQRMRPSLKRSIYFDCPHCKGSGLVKTPESMSLDVMRRLAIAAHDSRVQRIELTTCQEVASYLLNKKRRQLSEIEGETGKRIIVRQDPTIALDDVRLELYDSRDGLVFLNELGMNPHDHPQMTGPPQRGGRPGAPQLRGRRDDRRGPQGRPEQSGPGG